jgi:hypothetical protein
MKPWRGFFFEILEIIAETQWCLMRLSLMICGVMRECIIVQGGGERLLTLPNLNGQIAHNDILERIEIVIDLLSNMLL